MVRSAVVTFISTQICQISGHSFPMSESDRLDDLPLDSLQCLELTAVVEDHYGFDITCADRIGVETIGDFADLVVNSQSPFLQAA